MLTKRKQEGQYMTPARIVPMILDAIGYEGESILYKTIIEPSFGDGAFLLEIVKRLIQEGKNAGFSNEKISQTLNNNVYGIEKDAFFYKKALTRLNLVLNESNIPHCSWTNLQNADALKVYCNYLNKFDYVVGNPPFVKIHNIPLEYRDVVQNFKFTDGTIDLYIIFYEIGIAMLNKTGQLGYISPNSFLKNASQAKFREFLIRNMYLSAIYDFKESKLFEDADTYTCICILNKTVKKRPFQIDYKEYQMYNKIIDSKLDYEYFEKDLMGKAWQLGSNDDIEFLKENKGLITKLGQKFTVQNGIVTNRDDLYIKKVFEDENCLVPYMGKHTDSEKVVYFKDKLSTIWPIESAILHRCVKASRFNGLIDNTHILFPYKEELSPINFSDKVCVPYSEADMQNYFPLAYAYLCSVRHELEKRNMDKNLDWFLFGRTQGLQNSFQKKLVFRNIISKEKPCVVPYILDEDVVVYSKLYITLKNNSLGSLSEAAQIISSYEFWKYAVLTGKDMSGGYVDISSASLIKNFGIKI